MELLKERIRKDGKIRGTEVLKVDSFLNHQMDVDLFDAIGAEFKRRFADCEINKILTIEASGIGIACLAVTGLYSQSVEEVYDQHIASETHQFAVNLAHRYASMELGGIPKIYLEQYYGDWWLYNAFKPDTWFYTIADSSGKILESNLPEDTTGLKPYKIEVTNINYRQLLTSTPYAEEETIPETTMEPTSGMEEAECNEITESPVDYAGIEETAVTEPTRAYTVTSDGTIIDSWYDPAPIAGSNVEITLDMDLQQAGEDALAELFAELNAQPEGEDGQDAEGGAEPQRDHTEQVRQIVEPQVDPGQGVEPAVQGGEAHLRAQGANGLYIHHAHGSGPQREGRQQPDGERESVCLSFHHLLPSL